MRICPERRGAASRSYLLCWPETASGVVAWERPRRAPERGGSPGLALVQTGWGRLWPLPPLDAPACGNPGRISAKGLAPLGPEDATRTERTGPLRSVIQEHIEPVQRRRFKSRFVPQCFEILAVSGGRKDALFLDHCGLQGSVLPKATRPDAAS